MVPSTKVTVDRITTASEKKAYTLTTKANDFTSMICFHIFFPITWAAKDVSGYSVKFQRYFLRSPYLLSPKSSSFRRSSYFCWHRFSDSISWWILDLFLRNKFQNVSTTGQDIIVICFTYFKLFGRHIFYFIKHNS